jgi:uncharacterized membrane protein (DUF485 family)
MGVVRSWSLHREPQSNNPNQRFRAVERAAPIGGDESMADMARNIPTRAEPKIHKSVTEVIESPDFKRLVALRWTVSMVLLVLLFVSYYGYILLIPFAPEFMKSRVGEVTTMAIPLGIGAIVIAFALTAFYVVWANKSYDPEVERLKNQLRK